MCNDTLKLTKYQWTELIKALNHAPESEVLDQIAYEISMCVDLDLPELKVRESDMIIRASNRQKQLDEQTKNDLAKLDLSKLENIS